MTDLQQLVEMGFPEEDARLALKQGLSIDQAIERLLSGEVAPVDAEETTAPCSASEDTDAAPSSAGDTYPREMSIAEIFASRILSEDAFVPDSARGKAYSHSSSIADVFASRILSEDAADRILSEDVADPAGSGSDVEEDKVERKSSIAQMFASATLGETHAEMFACKAEPAESSCGASKAKAAPVEDQKSVSEATEPEAEAELEAESSYSHQKHREEKQAEPLEENAQPVPRSSNDECVARHAAKPKTHDSTPGASGKASAIPKEAEAMMEILRAQVERVLDENERSIVNQTGGSSSTPESDSVPPEMQKLISAVNTLLGKHTNQVDLLQQLEDLRKERDLLREQVMQTSPSNAARSSQDEGIVRPQVDVEELRFECQQLRKEVESATEWVSEARRLTEAKRKQLGLQEALVMRAGFSSPNAEQVRKIKMVRDSVVRAAEAESEAQELLAAKQSLLAEVEAHLRESDKDRLDEVMKVHSPNKAELPDSTAFNSLPIYTPRPGGIASGGAAVYNLDDA